MSTKSINAVGQLDNQIYWRDAHSSITVFSIVIGLMIGLVYVFMRGNLPTNLVPLLQVFSLSLFVLLSPLGIQILQHSVGWEKNKSWLSNDLFVSSFALILLVLLGWISNLIGINLYPVIAGLTIILCLLFARRFLRTTQFIWRYIGIILLGIILGIFLACGVWQKSVYGGTFTSPLFIESIFIGPSDLDTFFHAGIANLMVTHHQASTGLHGLSYFAYHYGSHWMIAGLSELIHIRPLELYQIIHILFYPFFVYTLLLLASRFRLWFGITKLHVSSTIWMWLALPIFLAGIFTHTQQASYSILWDTYVASQSYVLSLIALFIILDVILFSLAHTDFKNRLLTSTSLIGFIFILPIMIVLLGFLKISTLFVFMPAYAYMFLRLCLYIYTPLVIGFLVTCLLSFWVYSITSAEGFAYITLFAFIKNYVSWENVLGWIILLTFFSTLYIMARAYQLRLFTPKRFISSLIKRQIIDIEFLIVMIIVGLLPGMVFHMPGGAAGYFSDIQHWVAIAMLLAFIPVFISENVMLLKIRSQHPIRLILVLFILGVSYYQVATNYAYVFNSAMNRNQILYDRIQQDKSSFMNLDTSNLSIYQTGIQINNFNTHVRYGLYNILTELNELPLEDKRQTLLYIPKDNQIYWGWSPCMAIPSIATTLTGIAMIENLPARDCVIVNIGYSYQTYSGYQNPQNMTATELCDTALSLGFDKVIRLDFTPPRTFVAQQINCRTAEYDSQIIAEHFILMTDCSKDQSCE